jgi:hypothetical protein
MEWDYVAAIISTIGALVMILVTCAVVFIGIVAAISYREDIWRWATGG